ncbi:hypothetical protein HPB49_009712 [Dermacentor silvarum]|uniref:Uncharacterized protein n=1 Tax=Dermacentor silvarum TaxID=543639 RepID=A0ACB8DYC3_DERSI|nr:hypothetical protein HPB49_009712 [Dermacentor silvarum]
MSQTQRKRYRRYLQPNSNVQVPRQTQEYVLKRARSSTAASQVNLANLTSPSTNLGSVESSKNDAENSGQMNSNLASEMCACASTSAHVSDVEDSNEAASEIGTAYEDTVNFSSVEFSPAFELSDDGSEVDEAHNGDADSEPENGTEESEHAALEDDDFDMYFTKLSEEYLPNQTTTKAQALLLKIASVPHVSGVFADITDGILYRSVRKQRNMTWSDITLTMNTDGAPVFDASKNSIWPIQVMVNELPVLTRWQNVLVSGVWYSNVHPPMHLFMKQFVEEVNGIGKLKHPLAQHTHARCAGAAAYKTPPTRIRGENVVDRITANPKDCDLKGHRAVGPDLVQMQAKQCNLEQKAEQAAELRRNACRSGPLREKRIAAARLSPVWVETGYNALVVQLQRDVAPVVLAFKVLPRCLDSGDAYAERKMKKRLLLNRKLTATFKRMPCLRILNPEHRFLHASKKPRRAMFADDGYHVHRGRGIDQLGEIVVNALAQQFGHDVKSRARAEPGAVYKAVKCCYCNTKGHKSNECMKFCKPPSRQMSTQR